MMSAHTAWCKLFFGIVPLMVCSSLPAGVLLTKRSEVQIGTLTENETSVSLQVEATGAVQFKKELLLWWSVQPEIDTLLKAGKKAVADGNRPAAKILFELSAGREAATASQARAELDTLDKEPPTAAPPVSPAAQPGDITDNLSPEDKIARGRQMIENGKQLLQQQTVGGTSNEETGKQRIADGEKLVAQGQKELADIRAKKAAEDAKQAAEEAKKQAVKKDIEEVVAAPAAVLPEERFANIGLAAGLALATLFALWQITMKEPKE